MNVYGGHTAPSSIYSSPEEGSAQEFVISQLV